MSTLHVESWHRCPATVTLVGLTTCTYVFQALMGGDIVQRALGLIPARVSTLSTLFAVGEGQVLPACLTVATYVFLHGGWWHMSMNMIGLWCLGSLAEPTIGTKRFLLAYFASGAVCAVSIAILVPSWAQPVAGASGAIGGVLGGFLAMNAPRLARWSRCLVVGEAALVLGIALWLLLRTPLVEPDRVAALMWHLIPILAGGLYVQWVSRFVVR